METYFNTTNQKGNQLAQAVEAASTQQEIIKSLYTKQKRPLSASQVLNILNLNCPITSIRRSITNLKNEGTLEKTEHTIKGMYGRAEYQYIISEAWFFTQ